MSDALVAAQLHAFEAAGAAFAAAAADLGPYSHTVVVAPAEREAFQEELVQTHAALRRCERLGATLGDFARSVLVAQGLASGYDRSGVEISAPGGAFHARG
jgi:hypothetical protein